MTTMHFINYTSNQFIQVDLKEIYSKQIYVTQFTRTYINL